MTIQTFDFSAYKHIVIKVGSSLIAPQDSYCSAQYCRPIAHFIERCLQQKKQVTLVSSGAVAAASNKIRFDKTKKNTKVKARAVKSTEEKQALAAIGQALIINHWQKFFDRDIGQILLCKDDFHNDKRANNAKKAINSLYDLSALPIVNENDTVAIEELVFGDNDNLAAYISNLIGAELLIICSDISGLFTANPYLEQSAKLIPFVKATDIIKHTNSAGTSHNPNAKGGMQSKLTAAYYASQHQIDTIICNGTNESYNRLFDNINPGTWFSCRNNQTVLSKEERYA